MALPSTGGRGIQKDKEQYRREEREIEAGNG
jgi:hypothetical protein